MNNKKKKLVYRLGGDAGFFSEYNFFIYAIVYSKLHNLNLEINSSYANFRYHHGLSDYFVPPVLKENNGWFNLKFNNRSYMFKLKREAIAAKVVKKVYNIDYLTQDIFEDLRRLPLVSDDYKKIGLGNSNRLMDCCRVLINQLWVYNESTQTAIDNKISQLNLPEEYVGMHIRRGDKGQEAELFPMEVYFERAEQISPCRNAYILTDDYSIITEIQNKFPAWTIFTLCGREEKGYYFGAFLKLDKDQRRDMHLNLFASMEVMRNALFNIITYSSNVGSFLKMRGPDNVIGIDTEEWYRAIG
jgi:hypothetical protein